MAAITNANKNIGVIKPPMSVTTPIAEKKAQMASKAAAVSASSATVRTAAQSAAKSMSNVGSRAARANAGFNSKAKGASVWVTLAIGAFCVTMVFMTVVAASLKQGNNELEQENAYIQAEIDAIESKISSASNITTIESKAVGTYGMIYPDSDNYIALTDEETEEMNLASTIKAEAYQ